MTDHLLLVPGPDGRIPGTAMSPENAARQAADAKDPAMHTGPKGKAPTETVVTEAKVLTMPPL